ncbi:hypothetical protein SRHO_G00120500 [Serrasalmus rhombeus]
MCLGLVELQPEDVYHSTINNMIRALKKTNVGVELNTQTVVRRCEPIQPSCTADPGLSECLPSVAAAADKPAASPHCVSSSPGSQPCCFRKLCRHFCGW